ncbi:MAG TPA: 4-hydroxy-tetrahydrodipicolinate reductase [Oceanipulchritudo sp.]|nr:4-hydroxy-tetrahydrodipicolinate reductase [Oceanipulchritudo sp.]
MNDPLPVLICGYMGRMGQTLLAMAESEGARVAAQKDMGDSLAEGLDSVKVAIDFSFHSATAEVAEICADKGIALVIGTTGHTPEERERILACTKKIPIVWAGNYSIGVNLLFHLTETAARVVGNRYQTEIVEIHHRHKKDAPSGTALNLADALQAAPGFKDAARCYGREGDTGARPNEEIGIHALRGGEVVGEHTVYFFGEHDRIELTHRAGDRRIFASGAFRAAHWVGSQKPGLYSMRDVLGLTQPGEGPA